MKNVTSTTLGSKKKGPSRPQQSLMPPPRCSGAPMKPLVFYLQDAASIARVELLAVMWRSFWLMDGGFARKKFENQLKQVEALFLSQSPWLAEAIKIQAGGRATQTADTRRISMLHIESLESICSAAKTQASGMVPRKFQAGKNRRNNHGG